MKTPLIIGISGGTGSGKTRFSKELISKIDSDFVLSISQDSYYKDLSHISFKERCDFNFDHPESIDFKELKSDLYNLKNNKQVSIPSYDYKTHTRKNELLKIDPKPVIIIEGIFSLYNKDIRQLIDIKIFVDTPPDIRVLRRVKRDINTRGRSIKSIFEQYTKTVKPMHDKYIQPTMEYADIVILNGGKNKMALNIINSELLPIIKRGISNVDA